MKRIYQLLVLGVLVLLSGCSVYSMIPPGETQIGVLKVDNPANWSQFKQGDEVSWTYDGFLLNEVWVDTIKDGQHLFKLKINEDNKAFVLDSEADLEETFELYFDGLIPFGVIEPELISSEPVSISDREGLRFEISYNTSDNLKYRVIGLFVKDGKSLHRLFCKAPEEYYFPKHEQEFRKIVESARLVI